jgi:hypothetical protein
MLFDKTILRKIILYSSLLEFNHITNKLKKISNIIYSIKLTIYKIFIIYKFFELFHNKFI